MCYRNCGKVEDTSSVQEVLSTWLTQLVFMIVHQIPNTPNISLSGGLQRQAKVWAHHGSAQRRMGRRRARRRAPKACRSQVPTRGGIMTLLEIISKHIKCFWNIKLLSNICPTPWHTVIVRDTAGKKLRVCFRVFKKDWRPLSCSRNVEHYTCFKRFRQ